MNAKSFHLSAQGASHIKKNKECQDASISYLDDECAIAIVCDGHGGNDYVRSAIGSKLACAVAEKNIKSFATNVKPGELKQNSVKLIKNLEASIINGWNEAIYIHYESNPFLECELSQISEKAKKKYLVQNRIESAYGTTLIAVMMTKDYWFGIHIGDGKCVAVNQEGRFLQPIPWDDKCFLNATTSICDSSALENFRHFYSEKLPVAVFVGSDGIDDCFSNDEQLNNLYTTVLYSFASTPFEEAIEGLKDYLPRLSAKGSGDDVSVAAILDMDKIGDIESVKGFDKEKEKEKVEDHARKEAEKAKQERLRIETERAQERYRYASDNDKTKFCSNCGARIAPNMKFCSECRAIIIDKENTNLADEVNQHIEDDTHEDNDIKEQETAENESYVKETVTTEQDEVGDVPIKLEENEIMDKTIVIESTEMPKAEAEDEITENDTNKVTQDETDI